MKFKMILVTALFFGSSIANAESHVLQQYYDEYTSALSKMPEKEKSIQSKVLWNCHPFGDEEVGYYKTKEEYENAYDPSIYAKE